MSSGCKIIQKRNKYISSKRAESTSPSFYFFRCGTTGMIFQNELGKIKEWLKINKNLSGQKNINVEKANFGKYYIYWWCWVVRGFEVNCYQILPKER